jgi:branched-chain amino acid transport system permease protein
MKLNWPDFGGNYRRLIAALALLGLAMPFVVQSSTIFVLSVMFIYGILAFSAIVPIGYANQLVLSQGAFFGIGAYTFVLLTASTPLPSWISVVVATVVTAVVALLLGVPAIRAGGIYLGIITLAFNEMFVIMLDLLPGIFGGSKGLSSPSLAFLGLSDAIPSEVVYYYLGFIAFGGTLYLVSQILNSETGWALLALQEDVRVAESIGINTRRYRLLSFTFTGALCGFAGGLFAPLTGYISPSMFNLHTTIDIILAGVAGGISVPAGSILGGFIVVFVPEYLRFLSEVRFVVYGLFLVVLLIYLPNGIGGWLQSKLEQRRKE